MLTFIFLAINVWARWVQLVIDFSSFLYIFLAWDFQKHDPPLLKWLKYSSMFRKLANALLLSAPWIHRPVGDKTFTSVWDLLSLGDSSITRKTSLFGLNCPCKCPNLALTASKLLACVLWWLFWCTTLSGYRRLALISCSSLAGDSTLEFSESVMILTKPSEFLTTLNSANFISR